MEMINQAMSCEKRDEDPVAKRARPSEPSDSMQPRLKKFLKIYQLSSRNSLSGPSQLDLGAPSKEETSSLAMIANVAVAAAAQAEIERKTAEADKKENKARKKKASLKFLKCIQADQDTSQLMDTLLHGERISCFVVGGEKRLCLHDILNTILKDFSVQEINSACQKLSIACLESTPRQLEILKRNQLLPAGAPNCGLLTQTNSERLCAFLMDSSLSEKVPFETPPSSTSSSPASHSPATLKVFHECFGKTYGHIHLNMYKRHDSACIECDTCHKLYSAKNFVCHSHKNETCTRHWGFDSKNWRLYLKLAASQCGDEKNVLTDVKISNEENIAANNPANTNKELNEIKDKEKSLILQEEFDMFKQRFVDSELKIYKSSPKSLSDLNNHIKRTGEHKLLSDLLTRTNDSGLLIANQPNLVIQSNSMPSAHAKNPKPKLGQSANSIDYFNMLKCFSQQKFSHQTNFLSSSSNSSMELNMLEFILKEIQTNVSNKECAERLKQMVSQMHAYYTEKMNENYYIKNKYIVELEEQKMSLHSENEQLKCQLRLYQLQNELIKDPYLLKKNSPPSTNSLHLNNLLHGTKNLQQQSSPCTPASTSPSSSVLPKSQTTALIQNILMLQNQQANSNSLTQSFPFLFNQYPSKLMDPITSTPVKYPHQSKYTNACSTTPNSAQTVSNIKTEQKSTTTNLNTQTSAHA